MTDLATIDTEMNALDALLAEFAAATVEISLDDLNPAQRRAADRLVSSITFTDFEIKKLSVTRFDNRRSVTVYVETGLAGDEGTLASVFGRSKRHVTIGPRGAVKNISR
jgi:hypothetical protein